jgi:GTPase SAR1 family protein
LKDLKSNSSPDIKVFLIGNKSDLEDKRVITKEEAEKFKEEYELDFFMETSAKSGINTTELFAKAAKVLYNDYCRYKIIRAPNSGEILRIEAGDNNNNKKKKGCC